MIKFMLQCDQEEVVIPSSFLSALVLDRTRALFTTSSYLLLIQKER